MKRSNIYLYIILAICIIIIYFILDYLNIFSFITKQLNTDILGIIVNTVVVIFVFVITYSLVNKKTFNNEQEVKNNKYKTLNIFFASLNVSYVFTFTSSFLIWHWKNITVKECDSGIYIYYNTKFICSYNTCTNFRLNYKESHYKDILKQDTFKDDTEEELNAQIQRNLEFMDNINIEQEEQKYD